MNGGGLAMPIILRPASMAKAPAHSQSLRHCQARIVWRFGQKRAIARPALIRPSSRHPMASCTALKEKPLRPAIAVKKSAAREKDGARKKTQAAVVKRKVSGHAAKSGIR